MAWDIASAWNTADINARVTNACAVIDDAGTPKIIAPVQHGVKCFDRNGSLLWTYSSITNGYDVRDITVGNLNGTGYNDCTVVASGYYTTSTDGKVAIIDKDGNILDLLLTSEFGTTSTAPASCLGVAVYGTDIYVGTNRSFHKFSKSGSAWAESWYKEIGQCFKIQIENMGNGTRIYVATGGTATSKGVYCYQADGTQDWFYSTANQYTSIFAIGKSDSSKTGKQMAIPFQSGFAIIDKDGNLSQDWTTAGNNVRVGVTMYDCDGDGEDEIYFSDMADDVFCIERTGTNTYSQKYSKTDLFAVGKYGGLTHFDINNDGSDEIIACSTDGHLIIYDKTLATLIKDLSLGHGSAGGMFNGYQHRMNGISFVDTSEDGNEDVMVSGATGYVDACECSGFTAASSIKVVSGVANASVKVVAGVAKASVKVISGVSNVS